MIIAPQTNIILLKVPLELSNKNQLTFANKNAQYNYFNSLEKLELENATYQRKEGVIRFPSLIDNLYEFNYVMYQNEAYSEKWFYAFITNMRYLNDNVTEISIATDCFQTWQFDLTYKESFIEREMINTANDVAGSNLLDEGFEIGEPILNSEIEDDNLEPYFVIAYSGDYIEFQGTRTNIPQEGFAINGNPSSIAYIICGGIPSFSTMIQIINDSGMGDKIFTCFTIPKVAFPHYEPYIINGIQSNLPCHIISTGNYAGSEKEITFNKNTSLDGYLPRNKKLLIYPYNYIAFTALNGDKKIYRFEDFENNPTFKLLSEFNPNPSIIYHPINYRNSLNGLTDIAVLSGYPTLAYKNDYYNTWLAQNSNIIKLQALSEDNNYSAGLWNSGTNALNTAINAGMSTVPNANGQSDYSQAISGIISAPNMGVQIGSQVINHEIFQKMQLAQKQKQSLLPDNVNMGSSATLLGFNLLDKNVFSIFTIKRQYAEIIDKFFDMYGYLTNTLKLPNLFNRPNWNYVKTLGINIIAHIPQTDLQIIKNMYDNGVTLWHNPATFLDYSQNNR